MTQQTTTQAPPNVSNAKIHKNLVLGFSEIHDGIEGQKKYVTMAFLRGKEKRKSLAKLAFVAGVALGAWRQDWQPFITSLYVIGALFFYNWGQSKNKNWTLGQINKKEEKFKEACKEFSTTPSQENKKQVEKTLSQTQKHLIYKHNEIDVVGKIGVGTTMAASLAEGYISENALIGGAGVLYSIYGDSQLKGHHKRMDANAKDLTLLEGHVDKFKIELEKTFSTSQSNPQTNTP